MSENMNLIHPVTSTLVNRMNKVHDTMIEGDALLAVKLLRGVLLSIQKKDQPEQLLDNLVDRYNFLRNQKHTDPVVYRSKIAELRDEHWGWYDELTQVLYEKGYYSMEKFTGFYDPSGGGKSA